MSKIELQKALERMMFWWKTDKLTVCDGEMKENWVVETLDPQNFNSFADAMDEFIVKFKAFLEGKVVVDRKHVEDLKAKRKTGFEIQNHLDKSKTLAYPHDYWWVSWEDVLEVFGEAVSQKGSVEAQP